MFSATKIDSLQEASDGIQALYVYKLAYDNDIDLSCMGTDFKGEEGDYIVPLSDLSIELLSILYPEGFDLKYDEDDQDNTIVIASKCIKQYYKLLEQYKKVSGDKMAEEYVNRHKTEEWTLSNINSYCYSYSYTQDKRSKLIDGIEIETSPEFCIYCDLVMGIKRLMDYYEAAACELKERLKPNRVKKAS